MSNVHSSQSWENILLSAQQHFFSNWQKTVSSSLTINDFRIMKTLGTGAYGRVVIAQKTQDHKYYAVKILHKELIVKKKQVIHVLNEKQILQAIRFPFIIDMVDFFKDNASLYFVMPFLPGGELYTILRKYGKLTEIHSKFYASQIVLAYEFLHSLRIAYRDLKPENILLDEKGYIKLADLGFCKVIPQGHTFTICGTPEYLAPEVLSGRGYSFPADWWSLGILIFELIAGYPPFYSMENVDLFHTIHKGAYRMCPFFSEDLKKLIYSLLQTNPASRLGSSRGAEDLKTQGWFRNTNWLAIVNKYETSPFVPQLSGPDDTRYYESYSEEDLKTVSIDLYGDIFANF